VICRVKTPSALTKAQMCHNTETETVGFDLIQRTKRFGYKTACLVITSYLNIHSSVMFYLKQLWVAQNVEWNGRTSNKKEFNGF
jgi:hypothetical protein